MVTQGKHLDITAGEKDIIKENPGENGRVSVMHRTDIFCFAYH